MGHFLVTLPNFDQLPITGKKNIFREFNFCGFCGNLGQIAKINLPIKRSPQKLFPPNLAPFEQKPEFYFLKKSLAVTLSQHNAARRCYLLNILKYTQLLRKNRSTRFFFTRTNIILEQLVQICPKIKNKLRPIDVQLYVQM